MIDATYLTAKHVLSYMTVNFPDNYHIQYQPWIVHIP